jgi:hypothetical protein
VKDEGRLLARAVVKVTAPFKGKNGSARQSGVSAVEKDVKSLFSEANPATIESIALQSGIRDINVFRESKDGTPINFLWDYIDSQGDINAMGKFHDANRKPSTGRVIRQAKGQQGQWKARYVVPFGSVKKYLKTPAAHVGKAKASWAEAGNALGDTKYPRWINRHFGKISDISTRDLSNANNPTSPSIVMGSSAPIMKKERAKIEGAVQFRIKALGLRVKRIVSIHAKKAQAGQRSTALNENLTNTIPMEEA